MHFCLSSKCVLCTFLRLQLVDQEPRETERLGNNPLTFFDQPSWNQSLVKTPNSSLLNQQHILYNKGKLKYIFGP